MAVNPATGLSIDLSVQRMSRLEAKLFAEFEHHGIPMNLCVCKLSRQRGCSRQYATAAVVLAARSGPSIGCSHQSSKSIFYRDAGSRLAWGQSMYCSFLFLRPLGVP